MDQSRMDELKRLFTGFSDAKINECMMEGSSNYEQPAFELLLEEAKKRGLEVPDQSGAAEAEFAERQSIFTTSDVMEANFLKGLLEANNIDAYLLDENIVRLNPFLSPALGGIKISVYKKDVENAFIILSEHLGKTISDSAPDCSITQVDDTIFTCPSCSAEIKPDDNANYCDVCGYKIKNGA